LGGRRGRLKPITDANVGDATSGTENSEAQPLTCSIRAPPVTIAAVPERVRAAEVVGVLSLATDLGMGLPFEHGLQATIFAARLGEHLGLDVETRRHAYYACLLFHSACTTDVELGAEIFAGRMTRHHLPVMYGSQFESLRGVLRALPPPGSPPPRAALEIARRAPRAARGLKPHLTAQTVRWLRYSPSASASRRRWHVRTLDEHVETVVVGGGQAGLSVGYQLARRGLSFVILDVGDRVGDSWRGRWDSLRLFTPARYDGLAGMRFPAPRHSYPTKDAMADYLESYASRASSASATGSPSSKTVVCSTWRTCSGAADSVPASTGSTSPASPMTTR
jgi:hypothetical protein